MKVALSGSAGTGKTTLAKRLAGELTPMLHYLFTSDGPRQPPAAPSCIESQQGFLPQDGTTGDFL